MGPLISVPVIVPSAEMPSSGEIPLFPPWCAMSSTDKLGAACAYFLEYEGDRE